MKLTRQNMLESMLRADPASDGHFITGVVSTGIYCLPSCRARKPKPENVVFHSTPQQARAAGLRPCLRCKPDDFYAGVHRVEVRLDPLTTLPLANCRNVADLAQSVGLSRRCLEQTLWQQYQRTPAAWLTEQRVAEAQRLLLETNRPVTDIAFEVGFSSLSVFGSQFRRRSGMNAVAFRTMGDGQGFTLSLPADFSIPLLLAHWSRNPRQLTERVQGQRLSLALALPDGARVVQVELAPASARVLPTGPLNPADTLGLWRALWRVLGLGGTKLSHPKALLQQAAGVRLYLTPTPWDALVWAVLGQQVTLKAAHTFYARLVKRPESLLAGGLYVPPQPTDILRLTEEDWGLVGLTYRRVIALQALARAVEGKALALEGPIPQLARQLHAIPGLGPWSVAYVLLRGLGLPDIAPAGDNALATALQRHFKLPKRPSPAEVTRLMAPYAPSRSLATLYLWQSLTGDV